MTTVPHILAADLHRLGEDARLATGDHGRENIVEIEELISKAIHLHGRLTRQHERWAEPIREGRESFSLEEGKFWQVTFQQWCDDARRIIKQAGMFEADGQAVDQLDALRSALMRCDYDGIDVERLIANAAELAQGKGVSLAEITDELRRRSGASGPR